MMNPRRIGNLHQIKRSSGSTLMTLGALALSCCSALAQETEALRPPRVSDPPSAPKIMVFLLVVLLTAGVIFAATLKSKRGHQD